MTDYSPKEFPKPSNDSAKPAIACHINEDGTLEWHTSRSLIKFIKRLPERQRKQAMKQISEQLLHELEFLNCGGVQLKPLPWHSEQSYP